MQMQNQSKKRDAILRILQSTDSHPTAEWIHTQVRQIFPKISLGTVYRNLTLFRQMGEIISIGKVDGQERFDADISLHGHFVCNTCYAVIDFPQPEGLDASFDQHPRLAGAWIDRATMMIHGTCPDCLPLAK